MNRVVLHTITFLVIGAALLSGLRWISNKVDPVYAPQKSRMKLFYDNADKIEAISVGNSLNRAMNFNVLGIKGFHLWEPGSDYFEVEYRLRAMVPLMPALKVVFIPIGPTNFYLENTLAEDGDGRRRGYYTATPGLRSFVPINGDFRNLVIGKLADVVRIDHWQGFFDALSSQEHTARSRSWDSERVDNDGSMLSPRIKESTDKRAVKRDARRVLPAQEERLQAVLGENPGIADDVYKTLLSTVEFLSSRGVRTIFFTPPITEYFHQKLQQSDQLRGIYHNTQNYMKRLIANSSAEYYNYIDDSDFVHHYDYFIDHSHLNLYGSALFCKKFFTECGLPVVPSHSQVAN